MKIIQSIIVMLSPMLLYATDIQVLSAKIVCLDKENNRFKYGVSLLMQNTSENEIILITKANASGVSPEYDGKPAEISIAPKENWINNILVIPTTDKLGLVTLRTNESTVVTNEFFSKYDIKTAVIQYSATAIYNNHFDNWSGLVKSDQVNTFQRKSCLP